MTKLVLNLHAVGHKFVIVTIITEPFISYI